MLGFTSLLADNISTNVIGLVLATTFRFLMYRFWVFGANRAGGQNERLLAGEISVELPDQTDGVDQRSTG
jgi:putative flippase GtrA